MSIKQDSSLISYTQRYLWYTRFTDTQSGEFVWLDVYWSETFLHDGPKSVYTRHLESIRVNRTVEGVSFTSIEQDRICMEFREHMKEQNILQAPNIVSIEY